MFVYFRHAIREAPSLKPSGINLALGASAAGIPRIALMKANPRSTLGQTDRKPRTIPGELGVPGHGPQHNPVSFQCPSMS